MPVSKDTKLRKGEKGSLTRGRRRTAVRMQRKAKMKREKKEVIPAYEIKEGDRVIIDRDRGIGTVVRVHTDHPRPPYFSVLRDNGLDLSTTNKHLQKLLLSVENISNP